MASADTNGAEARNLRDVERDHYRHPGATNRDIAFAGLPSKPHTLLHDEIYPDDAYKGTVYWADLPTRERSKFVNQQANRPSIAVDGVFENFVITGVGFFSEGYVLFSVGNVEPLFEATYPQCFKKYTVCNELWVQAANYLEIVGIIFGQCTVGVIGDWIGRRWGLIQDALVMTIGSAMLTGMWGTDHYGWTVMYPISLLVFGFGVGGEYPMTSTSSMEGVRGQRDLKSDRLHRGRSVLLAFLMQGWGQLANQLVLLVAMLIFHQSGDPPYGNIATQETFRITFAIAVLFLLYFLYLRIYKMRNADHSLKASRSRNNVTGYDIESLKLTFNHYWHRLLATSLCWFCNDFPFYGNQIFRSLLLDLVTRDSTHVFTYWLWNPINVGSELAGYYMTAMLVDHKHYGRKRMQAVGFIMSFILFLITAGAFPIFDTAPLSPGPNSTIFLLAAEVYPAQIRATAYGLSAAVGKCGALTSTVLYNYIPDSTKFWVVCWFGLIGFCLTLIFIPDTTGMDLHEQERYWQFVREGRAGEYHGVAVHPRHLSLFERVVLKRHRAYDPKGDRDMKIQELRALYEKAEGRKGTADGDGEGEGVSENVSRYFEWERSSGGGGSTLEELMDEEEKVKEDHE